MSARIERLVAQAQRDLADAIQDAVADWGEDPPMDDIAHDLAQSIALGMDNDTARAEFCRREGVANPQPRVYRYHGSHQERVWEEQRRPMNEASRAKAYRHGMDWTNAEDARVLTWDRTEASLPGLAEELGRTTEAVRQRYTALHREPRDRAVGATTRKRRTARSESSHARSEERALALPTCPVCGLHHPGEC